jgi:hypothetical protein
VSNDRNLDIAAGFPHCGTDVVKQPEQSPSRGQPVQNEGARERLRRLQASGYMIIFGHTFAENWVIREPKKAGPAKLGKLTPQLANQ